MKTDISRRGFLRGGVLAGAAVPMAAVEGASVQPAGLSIAEAGEYDLVVAGGSCTGVFAALRAAEAGLRVALLEMAGGFGGTATQGLVPIWHSRYSADGKRKIIAGLTERMINELIARGEARLMGRKENPAADAVLNVAGLQISLDEWVLAAKTVTPFLHTRLAAVECEAPGTVKSVIVADKAGLRRLRAKFFIDATGDADLCRFAGLDVWRLSKDQLQTHTCCAILSGVPALHKQYPKFSFGEVMKPAYGAGLNHRFGWSAAVVGAPDIQFHAYTRVANCDPSDPADLTRGEIEGRAQMRRYIDAANRAFPMPQGQRLALVSLAAHLGLRESCHIESLYRMTADDILQGRTFDDVIARGSYRVDIHEGGGITFKYLDGRMDGFEVVKGQVVSFRGRRWRPKTETNPTWYEIPYRSIVPRGAKNVLAPGRALDCTREAFGACRVMVNCNQMGEAAGRAAAKAIRENLDAAHAYAGL